MAREKFVSDVTDELRSMQAVNVKFIDHPKQKISATTNINKYGSLIKVLKISFYVLKFMNIIYQKNFKKPLIKINNIFNGELLWLRDIQYKDSRFDKWKKSLNLFTDNQGVIRSRSRLPDTEKFEFDQRHLVLLPSSNYFTKLLILYTHDKVCHAGVESTLTKWRLKYWIIKGRQTVRKIINPCVTCKKVQGKVLLPPPTPALPEYRVCSQFPFEVTSFDFDGPLFVKDIYS